MKLLSIALSIALLPAALADSILVTYPKDTPNGVISDAKKSIENEGGKITHEYELIKGFSAEAPDAAVQHISTDSTEYKPTIERDMTVSISK